MIFRGAYIKPLSLCIYLFGFILTCFTVRGKIFLELGDAPSYMRFYNGILVGYDWPSILSEPTFIFIIRLASAFGEVGAYLLISLSIISMTYCVSRMLDINKYGLFLFFLVSPFAINKSFNFLTNAWRTTVSIAIAYLFIDLCMSTKKTQLLSIKIILFALLCFSHSSGPLLCLIYLASSYLRSPINALWRLKLHKRFLILLVPVLGLYFYFNYLSNNISYFIIRLDQYTILDSGAEQKSLVSLILKILILILIQYLHKKFIRRTNLSLNKAQSFYFFLSAVYFTSILAIPVSTIIADRIINCVYWALVLMICDLIVSIFAKNSNKLIINRVLSN